MQTSSTIIPDLQKGTIGRLGAGPCLVRQSRRLPGSLQAAPGLAKPKNSFNPSGKPYKSALDGQKLACGVPVPGKATWELSWQSRLFFAALQDALA
jgi:hypothetical protein